MSLQNIENWRTVDPNPGLPLNQIEVLPLRAEALLARNRDKPLLKIGYVNVAGAIEMLRGLCYHHDNFARLYDQLVGVTPNNANLDHEATAYFNRLGQFYYFAKSEFVAKAIADFRQSIPTIISYLIFRNKFSSHRSIDAPQGETEQGKIAHARALSSFMGCISSPRPGAVMPSHPTAGADGQIPTEIFLDYLTKVNRKSYRTYQTFDEKLDTHVSFTMQIEHPKIIAEAYAVIEAVVTHA